MSRRSLVRLGVSSLLAVAACAAGAAEVPSPLRSGQTAASRASAGGSLSPLRSGFEDMSRESQAMQQDDTANPGMLWVLDGETLWTEKSGSGRSCADCHGDARSSMKGVSARYPSYDAALGRPIDLDGRINQCRTNRQKAPPFERESRDLLALSAYIGFQSRGMPIAPDPDKRLEPFRARGEALYRQRQGQLNFSCAQCHDDRWGRHLGSAVIPQGHPNGYPLYRLEWQSLGSLQRRFRNCLTGVRAEPYPYGSPEYVDLELYLKSRAEGLPVETPAVRP
jgi:sulfur-oxidizing protein SoxA